METKNIIFWLGLFMIPCQWVGILLALANGPEWAGTLAVFLGLLTIMGWTALYSRANRND